MAYCIDRGQTMVTVANEKQQTDLINYLQAFITEDTLGVNGTYAFYIALRREERRWKIAWPNFWKIVILGEIAWRWQYQNPSGATKQCSLRDFNADRFWADRNPPGFDGGSVEFNCASIQINDPRYPDTANWVAQRCDFTLTGRDSYVCVPQFEEPIRCKPATIEPDNNNNNHAIGAYSLFPILFSIFQFHL